MVQTLSFVCAPALATPTEGSVGPRSLVRCAPRFSRSSWLTGVCSIKVRGAAAVEDMRRAAS
jgi:hypothetical protein